MQKAAAGEQLAAAQLPPDAEEAAHGPSTTASADAEAAQINAELEERAEQVEAVRSELAAVQAELAATRQGAGKAAEAAAGDARFIAMWQVKGIRTSCKCMSALTCLALHVPQAGRMHAPQRLCSANDQC